MAFHSYINPLFLICPVPMPPTLDSCSLTHSQRETENLQEQEMRTIKPRQSLLSCLSDDPSLRENWNWSNREAYKTLNSEEILSQGLKCLSRTSEIRKWPNSRLYTRSSKQSKKQTLMKMSDKRPLTNTPLKSTLLTHNSEALSNKVNMQHSLLESETSQPLQGIPMEMSTGQEGNHTEKDQIGMKLGDSCTIYKENLQGSADTGH